MVQPAVRQSWSPSLLRLREIADQTRANKYENRVDADDFEWPGEATPTTDVEDQQARGKRDHGEAAGQ